MVKYLFQQDELETDVLAFFFFFLSDPVVLVKRSFKKEFFKKKEMLFFLRKLTRCLFLFLSQTLLSQCHLAKAKYLF